MDFKERLKDLRTSKGLSQRELGKRLGITNSAISMYERGEREPDYETLEAIADLFNVDIAYLLGKDDVSTYLFTPQQSDLLMKLSADEDLYALVAKMVNGSDEQRERIKQMLKLMEIK